MLAAWWSASQHMNMNRGRVAGNEGCVWSAFCLQPGHCSCRPTWCGRFTTLLSVHFLRHGGRQRPLLPTLTFREEACPITLIRFEEGAVATFGVCTHVRSSIKESNSHQSQHGGRAAARASYACPTQACTGCARRDSRGCGRSQSRAGNSPAALCAASLWHLPASPSGGSEGRGG